MNIMLVTDAWMPQVNGVVTTLRALCEQLRLGGHTVQVIHPGMFRTRPCPGYAGIDVAVRPASQLKRMLDEAEFDTIHLATEGPLGWAARRYCMQRKMRYTSAYHTRFPEILHKAARIPLSWGYALFRHFHSTSSGVMVPTQSVLQLLEQKNFNNLRPWTHGIDAATFAFSSTAHLHPSLIGCNRPIALYVGRISYEKNVEDFLRLSWPGSKVICGDGPLANKLRERYPDAHWLGELGHDVLPKVYASADVLALPSRHETFGLVLLEAMSCGTPVAAYPVEGPTEVLGKPAHGGVMHEDLLTAMQRALQVSRHEARQRALQFSWASATHSFLSNLVAARADAGLHRSQTIVPLPSQKIGA
jgi:glycosyltransferase involved in cell wall biosynthesis